MIALQGMGFVSMLAPLLIAFLLLRQIGNVSLMFAGNDATADGRRVGRLPARHGSRGCIRGTCTPANSILFVGALTLAFTLAGQIGVGLQEAFQILENAGGIFYAFAYIAMFSIPLFARATGWQSGRNFGFRVRLSRVWRRPFSIPCSRSSRSSTWPIGGYSPPRS